MTDLDFGTPVPVTELPPASPRGGRQSNEPAIKAWLDALPGPGTFELASTDEDGGHPISRKQTMVKLVKASYPNIRVDSRPIVPGKRYRIFATNTAEATAKATGKK